MSMKKQIKNSELRGVVEALAVVGRTKVPIPLAVRMAETRKALSWAHDSVEDVRAGLVERHKNGSKKELEPGHPGWDGFASDFEELMEQAVEVDEGFTLYQRTKDGEDQYAWAPDFKSPMSEMEPNVIYGLLPLIDIVSTDDEGSPE